MTARAQILVIEDDPDVVALLSAILEHEGLEVAVAQDGLDGLLRLQTAQVDLALLDIMMPDVDGLRVLEQLHEESGGALPVPVIVMTGSPEGAQRSRALLGPADVFEKPFDPTLLLERVHARLDGD